MNDWLKLAGREGEEKVAKATRLLRVRKSEKIGFKARQKLIARERKCTKRVGRSRISDWGGTVCVRTKDLKFIDIEFHKWGDELRNELSENLSLVEPGGRGRHR